MHGDVDPTGGPSGTVEFRAALAADRPVFRVPTLRLRAEPSDAPPAAVATPAQPPRAGVPAPRIVPTPRIETPAHVPAPTPTPAPAPVPVVDPGPARPALDRSAPPVIEVRSLVKEYAAGKRVVDGIDITIAPGEIYGFLGPNGAGKSTTVNMLVTLLPPSAGSARICGFDIATQDRLVRRHIGAALQSVALDPFLTPREHLRLVAALHGAAPSRSGARVDQMLERVGLSDVADRRCGGFSGGMKRRLDLALALVHDPQVLFLDEPTTGLDPQSRTALWDEVRRLAWDEGVTVFLTTQYLEEADVLADRIGIIDRGTIVAEGTPDALKAEIGAPTVEVTPSSATDHAVLAAVLDRFGSRVAPRAPGRIACRLDTNSQTSLVEVVRALDHAGLDVDEVRIQEATLDDVFLAHTGRSLEGARR